MNKIPEGFNYYRDVKPIELPIPLIQRIRACIVLVKQWCPPALLDVRFKENTFRNNQWNKYYLTVYFKQSKHDEMPRPFVRCGGRTWQETLNKFFDVGRKHVSDMMLDEMMSRRSVNRRISALRKFAKSLPEYKEND